MLSVNISAQVPETDLSISIGSMQVNANDDLAQINLTLVMINNGPDAMNQPAPVFIRFPSTHSFTINLSPSPCNFELELNTLLSSSALFPALQTNEEYSCSVLLVVEKQQVSERYYDLHIAIEELGSNDPELNNNLIQRRLWIGSDPIPIPSLSHVSLFLLMILVLVAAGYVAKTSYVIRKDEVLYGISDK